MDAELDRTAEGSVLKLKGSWTVERARELKRALLDALNSGERIIIESQGITELDLSAMQLLCSAHRMSLRLGKHLSLHEQKSKPLKRMARDLGFARARGCHRAPLENCLWTGGWT